jgi:hypothetical protein
MLKQAMLDDQMLITKGLMSQEEHEQEWFLSTEAAIKGAYYANEITAMRRDGRSARCPTIRRCRSRRGILARARTCRSASSSA